MVNTFSNREILHGGRSPGSGSESRFRSATSSAELRELRELRQARARNHWAPHGGARVTLGAAGAAVARAPLAMAQWKLGASRGDGW